MYKLLLTIFFYVPFIINPQEISFNENNPNLEVIISEIESQTDLKFAYGDDVNLTSKLTGRYSFEKEELDKVLEEISNRTTYTFSILGSNIAIAVDPPKEKAKSLINIGSKFQQVTVEGIVTDSNGIPLPSVTVQEEGTNNGMLTDFDGNYSIEVRSEESVLVFSYIGMETTRRVVGDNTIMSVQMEEGAQALDEVVVTALGITRDAKSLTYATQKVGGEEITKAKDPNFLNTLAGKVAGAVITKGNFGPGSSPRILMRGNKSLTGNSDPLFVLNGVPMYGGTDLLANINPEDIESLQILKGASAAALYGSEAANGVVIVNTKKGTEGVARIEFSSQFTLDKAIGLPELQTNYGQADPTLNDSWGSEIANGSDEHLEEFFDLGQNYINSVSFSNGNEQTQVYLSYANTQAKGILPENDLTQNNYTLRLTTQLLNNKLTLDGSVNYTDKRVYNQNSAGGYSALPGVYSFPVGDDWSQYSGQNFEVWDPVRQMNVQNWPYIRNETFPNQNPYWVQNKNQSDFLRDHFISSISANYKIIDGLNLQGRATYDLINDKRESRDYASTQSTVAGINGGYGTSESNVDNFYSDLLLILDKDLNEDILLSGTLGFSHKETKISGINLSSTRETSLTFPNYFSVYALNGLFNKSESLQERMTQSAFGSATVGFKDKIFLDVTGRNEWTSTVKESFFYPSVGLAYVLPAVEALGLTFAKIRGSYAEVGRSLPFGVANWTPPYSLDNSGNIIPRGVLPFFEGADTLRLKPELTKSYEVGLEARFLKGKGSLNLTAYSATSRDQLLQIQAPAGAGAQNFWINGGVIRNRGIEGVISYDASLGDIKWKPSVNFSANQNRIIELSDRLDADRFVISSFNQSRVVASYLTRPHDGEYGSFGDLYGRVYQKDENGNLLTNDEGLPLVSEDTDNFIGNANPDFLVGFNNTFTYKNASLSFLIDGRFGGGVVNRTEIWLDYKGLSRRTGEARDNGGVLVNGQLVDAKKFYLNQTGAGASAVASEYFYDATNIRLRELALGYTLTDLGDVDLNFSLVGRNLFFFYLNAPFDPEISASTSTSTEGIASFTMPTTRSFGLSMRAIF
jgi:TonB-linked SusC/RagA family outer membrane protein